jgi:16S rRNA (adenine1518-N6/adenine1519-N6)-dimethyltransferase
VVQPHEEEPFRRLVLDSFGMRRKQLRRVLRSVLNASVERAEEIITEAGVDPMARPETLSPDDFARILRASARR